MSNPNTQWIIMPITELSMYDRDQLDWPNIIADRFKIPDGLAIMTSSNRTIWKSRFAPVIYVKPT